jgi:sugar diacid utilization regulator
MMAHQRSGGKLAGSISQLGRIGGRGSAALTAQAVHTHRNTVSYRLRQIDELPRERDDTRVRCALELAHYLPHREPDG